MLEYLIALLIGCNFSTPILNPSSEEKEQIILLQDYNDYIQQGGTKDFGDYLNSVDDIVITDDDDPLNLK